ncbi:MAG: cation:proton antiporter [Gammaproteobacteria bacterium]|nr:cation:proton antiporter [Gammaproteobacteria bacterium]
MSHIPPLILDLSVILGAASVVAILFQYIKQPVVLGYLVAGLLIGPHTPPYAFVSDIPTLTQIAELGVIFLMFSIGLEFSFQKICKVGLPACLIAIIEVSLMIVIGYALGRFIGWKTISSLFLGVALAISSTTIIVKTLSEMQLKDDNFTNLVFGILIIEDLLAILLLAALSTIATTQTFSPANLLIDSGELLFIISSWFVLGYFIVPRFFRLIRDRITQETLTLLSVSCCLFLVCVSSYLHYSLALGAFIMGSILAGAPQVHLIENLLKPLRDIFAAVFFVSVGMLVDPRIIVQHYELILLISVVAIVGKIITSSLGGLLTRQGIDASVRLGFTMAQIGEFSFIIIGVGVVLGAVNQELSPIIVSISAITTFLTPYLIRISAPIGTWLSCYWRKNN